MSLNSLKDQITRLIIEYHVLDKNGPDVAEDVVDIFWDKLSEIVSQSNHEDFIEVKKLIRILKLNKINDKKN